MRSLATLLAATVALTLTACNPAERCAQEFVSLPMFPELSAEQIDYVGSELMRLAGAQSRTR